MNSTLLLLEFNNINNYKNKKISLKIIEVKSIIPIIILNLLIYPKKNNVEVTIVMNKQILIFRDHRII